LPPGARWKPDAATGPFFTGPKRAIAKPAAGESPVSIRRLRLPTDNAALIAAAGMRQLAAGRFAPSDLAAAASLPL